MLELIELPTIVSVALAIVTGDAVLALAKSGMRRLRRH